MHREALAAAVRRRRGELGLKQAELATRAGLRTRKTVAAVEAGKPVKEFSLYALDRGLGWPTGTALHIVNHGHPPTGPEQAPVVEFTDPDERAIAELYRLPWETRQILIETLRRRRGDGGQCLDAG